MYVSVSLTFDNIIVLKPQGKLSIFSKNSNITELRILNCSFETKTSCLKLLKPLN